MAGEGRTRVPPLLAGLAIVAALLLALVLTDEHPTFEPSAEEAEAPPAEPYEEASPAAIAKRLEDVRELEFDEVPRVQRLTAAQWAKRVERSAKRKGRDASELREAHAVEELLKLGGLAAPTFEVEDATAGIGELVGGFYRPKSNKLVLVENPIQGPRGDERVTAHEFEHALQDQSYPEALKLGGLDGEREIALSALVEGDASVVERRYARRHLAIDTLGTDKSLLSPTNLAVGLPPALVASVRFPYTAGADFVAALPRRGGWPLVDRAFRHPPTTTEQVLHPGKWLAGEKGARVEMPAPGVLGPGWSELATVESGELDAIVILAAGVGADVAKRAAKGWDGGAFAAYRLGGNPCAELCRDRRAAAVTYRWASAADAAEFGAAAARYLAARIGGSRRGFTFDVGDGAATVAVDGRTTAIAFAPSAGDAERLARAAARDTTGS